MAIDGWTLGLQAINVLILVWLLGRFFWRPMAAMIASRRATIQQALADAQAARATATAAAVEVERTRAGFAQERTAILAAAEQDAARERAAQLAAAQAQATALVAAAQAQTERDRVAFEQSWGDRAGRLAVEIASRLLAPLDGDALHAAFLERLLRALRELPEPTRRLAADGASIEVVSAQPLDAALQARCRAAILDALHSRAPLDFAVDATLVAGLELRGPHLAVSNSWRADLDRVRQELMHERHD